MSSEHRLHPHTIIFAFLAQVRVFIVPGLLLYFGVGSRENDWWQPWMMVFILPSAAVAVVRYLTYRFSYEDNELVIRTGLLFRKERHIPYARIQNIDAVQNVLHRLLNVVDIKIETGGGQSAEATMSVLPSDALAEMRRRVFADRDLEPASSSAAASRAADAAPAPLLELNLKELLLCGFIENRGAVLVTAAFGVVWELGLFDRFVTPLLGEPTSLRGLLRDVASTVVSSATISWIGILVTLAAFIVLLMLIRVLSMAWSAVRLYGFRLALVGGDARTEFGLLTRVAMTIPLRRVQALTVRESPLHRLFSRVAVKVDTAGGRADEQNQLTDREYLAPILTTGALDHFVESIVGVSLATVTWQPVHPRAFRREVKGWLVVAFVLGAVFAWYVRWAATWLAPVLVGWAITAAFQTVKHLGWALTDDAVLFKRGWLWRRIVVVRFAKVQTVSRYESPFDRRTGMARIFVDTAGASAGSTINIPYVPDADARALFERLAREAAQRQFKW